MIKYFLIFVCCIVLFACGRTDRQLNRALKLAGSNRPELEKVLEHYSKNEADNLKLRAAKYLISNCYIHSSQSAWFEDYNKRKINFFPPEYGTSDKAKSARDSLYHTANYISNVKYDCLSLESGYLIAHIDTMLLIWQLASWKSRVDFTQFCRYILPYRVLNEPQSNWATLLVQKYKPIADSATNIISAAKAVNKAIAHDIKYNNCWVGIGIGLQSIPELISHQSGMCDDLSVYGVCAMRAIGIPATLDFTIWAKTNMGHSWGVIFDENGTAVSFGPGEQNPGEHKEIFSQAAHRKLAKVFRRSFEINQSGLWSKAEDVMSIPPFFRQMNITDVTAEYSLVYDVVVPVRVPETTDDFVYICVFNSGKWTPIHWTQAKNGIAKFTDMGDDLLYVIGKFDAGEMNPISVPFIFEKDQHIFYLDNTNSLRQTITIKKYLPGLGYIKNKPKHQLYKWQDNNWTLIQEINVLNDSVLTINNLADHSLYKFEENSRPFTIENNQISWW